MSRLALGLSVLALALALALAACAGSEDPCAVPTGGVNLSPDTLQNLAVGQSQLDCSGKADGVALSCAGSAQVTRSTCTDGFALTLDSGNAKLLIHFANTDHWTAGAKLSGGKSLAAASDMTIAGLGADPQPKAGTTQEAKFDFTIGQAKLNGQLTTTW